MTANEEKKGYKILFHIRGQLYSIADLRPILLIESLQQRQVEQERSSIFQSIIKGDCWAFVLQRDKCISNLDADAFIDNPKFRLAMMPNIIYAINYSTGDTYGTTEFAPEVLRYIHSRAGLCIG